MGVTVCVSIWYLCSLDVSICFWLIHTHKCVCVCVYVLVVCLKPLYCMCIHMYVPACLFLWIEVVCRICLGVCVCVADDAVVLEGDFRQIWPH